MNLYKFDLSLEDLPKIVKVGMPDGVDADSIDRMVRSVEAELRPGDPETYFNLGIEVVSRESDSVSIVVCFR